MSRKSRGRDRRLGCEKLTRGAVGHTVEKRRRNSHLFANLKKGSAAGEELPQVGAFL